MEDEQDQRPDAPSRRSVLRGGAVAGLALPLVSACGAAGSPPATHARPSAPSGGGSDGGSGGGSGHQRHKRPKPLIAAGQVPVGGGKILASQQIVVTQPSKGDYKAFSAVCTHQQCLVTMVRQGVIICPCHGSEFSIKDGSVVRGPASAPLPSVQVEVDHGEVRPG